MRNELVFRRFENAKADAAKCYAVIRSLELSYEDCVSDRLNAAEEESLIQRLLLEQAAPSPEGKGNDGLWSLYDVKDMPKDRQFELAYRPTCLATAILIHLLMKEQSRLLDKGYYDSLLSGLQAVTRWHREENPQGFEPGFLDVYGIYHRCGIYEFLMTYPKFCSEFSDFWLGAVRRLLSTKLEANFWTISYKDAEIAGQLSREVRERHSDFVGRMPHSPDSARLFFLSYDTNMNLEQMKRRCEDAVLLGTTEVEDYRLSFRKSRSSHYATMDRQEGARTPAVLWALTRKDMQALELYEGVPHCYQKHDINVNYQGTTIKAIVFLLPETNPLGRPAQKYEQLIRKNYDYLGFDPSTLEEALEEASKADPPKRD
ncbi:MAG: gamma-glutamylcyclotransferase family protein [Fretibacterium sp.]|nr:gamma-glutamylcyclotransferase family protein [Fretibacterium sp.]